MSRQNDHNGTAGPGRHRRRRDPADSVARCRPRFYHRLLRAFSLALMLLLLSLCLGVCGYHFIGGLNWVDSYLNASMILSGMGPVDKLEADGAKIFAACYALFSGVIFITASGIIISPLLHRVLHRFHVEEDGK